MNMGIDGGAEWWGEMFDTLVFLDFYGFSEGREDFGEEMERDGVEMRCSGCADVELIIVGRPAFCFLYSGSCC